MAGNRAVGNRLISLLAVLCLLLFAPVRAQVDTFAFDTIEQQQRFRRLSNELRCPQCQNANLTGSTGGIAEDLRREVHRMIMQGMTDQQIRQFMFERYGDFILYRPRLRAATMLLWFGPLLFLLLGSVVVYSVARRAGNRPASAIGLNAAEQTRLQQMLEQDRG